MKKQVNFYLMGASLIIVLLSFVLFPSCKTDPKEKHIWCPLCGMNLKMYHQTSNRLAFKDGTTAQTCSIFCAAQLHEKRGAEITKWDVVDYQTKDFIDAKKAQWLMGSDIPGVMSAVSKIAFLSKENAETHQKKHGGEIVTFDTALNQTLADMGSDKKMIMSRVAEKAKNGKVLAEKFGCYNCHGAEGKGGSAIGWNNAEFIKKMDSRVKIKEAILNGTKGMKGYKGRIEEKDLHPITLYIWSLRAAK